MPSSVSCLDGHKIYKMSGNIQWLNLHDYKYLQQVVCLYSVLYKSPIGYCIATAFIALYCCIWKGNFLNIAWDGSWSSLNTWYEIILLRTDIARIQQPCNKVARRFSHSDRGGLCIIWFGMDRDGKMRDKHCHLPSLNHRHLSGGWARATVVSIHCNISS